MSDGWDKKGTIRGPRRIVLRRNRVIAEGKVEAPPGFEPGVEVLQTSALPLGDGADRNLAGGIHRISRSGLQPREGEKVGAGNGIRTRDFDLGKVALYH